MYDVVSLGSVNVDHVGYLADEEVTALETGYEWFPHPGETVRVDAVPRRLRAALSETHLGGKGANQAVAAAHAGADTAFLGAVGDDADRYGVRDGVASHGVDVSHVKATDGPTGSAYVVVDEDGENRIAILGGANDAVDRAYVREQLDRIASASCLLLQNEIPVSAVEWLLDRLLERGGGDDEGGGDGGRPTVVLDPAPPAGVEPLVCHDAVDLLVPNATEYVALGGEADGEYVPGFEGTLVVTAGSDAVRVSGPEVQEFVATPPAVEPVDTTGAGDVFTGYLGATLAATGDLKLAVERGTVAAALSTEQSGVQSAVPDLERVDAVLEERRSS